MTATLFRRTALALALAAVSLAALPAAAQQDAKPVRILTNWFAQPDQAGYWQAQQDDLGRAAGLKIGVLQGGPKIQTIPQVASGQAEFGIGNADDVLLARLRGAPVRAVFAHLDHVPYALVYHADPAVKSIADLQGRTFAVNVGNAYWEWTKKQYKLAGTREIPVSGDLSLFRNDPKMVQQGYSLYLPARMAEAGIPVQSITLASLGYRPYNVLFTTDELIRKNPALVKCHDRGRAEGLGQLRAQPVGPEADVCGDEQADLAGRLRRGQQGDDREADLARPGPHRLHERRALERACRSVAQRGLPAGGLRREAGLRPHPRAGMLT